MIAFCFHFILIPFLSVSISKPKLNLISEIYLKEVSLARPIQIINESYNKIIGTHIHRTLYSINKELCNFIRINVTYDIIPIIDT